MWGQIYDPSSGLLNGILTGSAWTSSRFAWLGNEGTAMIAVMFVIVWGLVGFYMVLFIAGIKGVPAELFEAARIDGAGRFRTAVSITIPLIRDNVQTAYIYMGILALDAFVYMAALNRAAGRTTPRWSCRSSCSSPRSPRASSASPAPWAWCWPAPWSTPDWSS